MAPSLPRSPAARIALALAAVAIVVLGVVGTRGFVERRARVSELERMRDGLVDLRAAAETCQVALRREEQAFAKYRTDVDSIRRQVRGLESLDTRGVPAERYEEYLETFDQYNESLPGWEARGDSLQARSEACRALVERHNALADSLRAFMDGMTGEDDAGA